MNMKIRIDEQTFSGTPTEILAAFRDESYFHDEFPTLEDYIRHEQSMYVQYTGQPCPLPEHGTTGERAAALLHFLAEIDALEVLEDV